MTIQLSKEVRDHALESIKRYFDENMEEEIGDLKAILLLDFFLEEIGATVYNQAIRDAQRWFQERVTDLDGSCFQPEFGYWK